MILGAQDFYQGLQIGGYQKEVLRWRVGSIVEVIEQLMICVVVELVW